MRGMSETGAAIIGAIVAIVTTKLTASLDKTKILFEIEQRALSELTQLKWKIYNIELPPDSDNDNFLNTTVLSFTDYKNDFIDFQRKFSSILSQEGDRLLASIVKELSAVVAEFSERTDNIKDLTPTKEEKKIAENFIDLLNKLEATLRDSIRSQTTIIGSAKKLLSS
jgi:hypothetical protein